MVFQIFELIYIMSPAQIRKVLDIIMPHIIAYVIFTWAIIGFYYLFKYIYHVIYGLYARILRPGKDLKRLYGSWAIVTGSTDGIGRGMSVELAKKGLNLVLISRNEEKLKEVADFIREKWSHIEVKFVVVDFSDFNDSAREAVSKAISGLDVGVLVNNVGVSYPFPKYFHELTQKEVDDMVQINVTATTAMTHLVLPSMVAKRTGAIVNVSSAAGATVTPLLSEYSGTKSFVISFSKALSVELSDFNIHVQVQVPFLVATKLSKIRHSSLFVPDVNTYSRAAVACIGYDTVISPYWSHAVQLWLLSFIPMWNLEAWIMKIVNKGTRSAALKKLAKSAEDKRK